MVLWSNYLLTILRNYFGWVIDALNSASHSLNFTYTIQNPIPLKFGFNKDGSYRGPAGMTMRRNVDFSIGGLPVETINSRVILPIIFFINVYF